MISLGMAKDIPRNGRRELIGGILDEINEDVTESMATGLYDSREDYIVARTPMIFDAKGCEDGHGLGAEYIDGILKIAGESATRLGESDDPEPFGVSAVLLFFRSAQAERERDRRASRRWKARRACRQTLSLTWTSLRDRSSKRPNSFPSAVATQALYRWAAKTRFRRGTGWEWSELACRQVLQAIAGDGSAPTCFVCSETTMTRQGRSPSTV